MTVRMTHPDHDGEYPAAPSQVPFLQESGWQVAEGEDTSEVEAWPDELKRYGGQPEVRLYNPTTGAYFDAAESAVPFHRERGWQVVEAEPEATSEAEPLDSRTVPELRELAKARGISPIPATKPELLAALTSQPAADQATEESDQAEPAEPAAKEE